MESTIHLSKISCLLLTSQILFAGSFCDCEWISQLLLQSLDFIRRKPPGETKCNRFRQCLCRNQETRGNTKYCCRCDRGGDVSGLFPPAYCRPKAGPKGPT